MSSPYDPQDQPPPSPAYGMPQAGQPSPAYGTPQAGPGPAYGTQPPGPGYGMPQTGQPGPPPENNLVWAILCTVLCCLPLGIVSIIKSTQVNTFWAQGLYDEARKSAADAKKWAMWGAIISVGVYVIVAIIYVIFFAFLFSHMPNPSHFPTTNTGMPTDIPTDIPTT